MQQLTECYFTVQVFGDGFNSKAVTKMLFLLINLNCILRCSSEEKWEKT